MLEDELSSDDSEDEDDGGVQSACVDGNWKEGPILTCQRMKEVDRQPTRGNLRHQYLKDVDTVNAPLQFFLHFLPSGAIKQVLELTTAKGMAKYRPSWCLSLALFYKWLGLWILMTRCELPNRERYWEEGDGRFDPDFHFRDIMSFHLFQEILGVLTLPQDLIYI